MVRKCKTGMAYLVLALSIGCFAWLSAGVFYLSVQFGTHGELFYVMPFMCGITIFAAAAIGFLVLISTDVWKDAFRCDIWLQIVLWLLALYAAFRHGAYMAAIVPGAYEFALYDLFTLGAAPALYVYLYLAYRFFGRMIRELFTGCFRLTGSELGFFLGFITVACIAMCVAFLAHPVLYNGHMYGAVYTFDSQRLVRDDVFAIIDGPENDLKNLLFGMFTMPLAIICHIIDDALYFMTRFYMYPFLIGFVQIITLAACIILLARMACKNQRARLAFCILFSGCYVTMLNVFILEQYIFSIFWVVACMWFYIQNKSHDYIISGVVATGCLTSSAVLFAAPLIERKHGWRGDLKSAGIYASVALLLSGKIIRILASIKLADDTLGKWANLTGSWSQKFYQFLTAIRSIFLQPRVEPVINWVGCEYSCPWLYKTSYDIRFDLFGWVVLIICIIGFVINYKDVFSRFCMGWIAASFLIMFVAGFGTTENELVIYMLYFGWAYVGLLFKLAERAFRKLPIVLYLGCVGCAAAMAAVNIPGLAGMFEFFRVYYPGQ